jgi:SNF2 family DNA or RNA helicase
MDTPNPEELKKQLEEAKNMLNELSGSMAELKIARDKIRSEENAHRAAINKLQAAAAEIESKAWDFKNKMRETEDLIREQSKHLAVAEENERAKKEFMRLSAQFDEAITAFQWGKSIKPYQIEGAKKLAIAKRAILGDKRGLGKTLTSIAFDDLVGARKTLIIVPNDIMGNFLRELHFWAPHRGVMILGGLPKIQRNALLSVAKGMDDITCIINYEAWRKDNQLIQNLIDVKFDTVICDEAHNIKNMSSNAYRGVKKIVHGVNECPVCGGNNIDLEHHVKYKGYTKQCRDCLYVEDQYGEFCSVKNFVPMTGTPILNKPQDIFPLLHLVNPVMFPDSRQFLNMFCVQGFDGKWRFQAGGEERLATRISGMYVARDRYQAGVEIPKQAIQIYELELDAQLYPNQTKAYEILKQKSAMVVDNLLAEVSDDYDGKEVISVAHMIALITRERQMMTWPAGIVWRDPKTKEELFRCDVTESVKLDRIITPDYQEGLIPELVNDEQERVVVFSQFKQPLIELERRIKAAGISVVRYDGDTSRELANEIQIDFDRKYQSPDKPYKWDVVLANYKKGGVGLNLNAATQMIILDEEWNPGKEDQAYGRIDRLGQSEETTVHVLRVKDSVDVWMANLIQTKREMIQGFETHTDLQQELMDILRGVKKGE